ncbi:MAG: class A beta-lactamase-related serine hydrolase [Oscillospiraceae bacterium]|nr:class A beta-lactamase-related serine hydrolase [Oscillospiraceae bacterium]
MKAAKKWLIILLALMSAGALVFVFVNSRFLVAPEPPQEYRPIVDAPQEPTAPPKPPPPRGLQPHEVDIDAICTEDIEQFLQQFEPSLAVYFRNIDHDFAITRHAQRVFHGASVSKAPFALYIFQMAQRGETCLNDMLTFTAADYWGGSGIIRHRYAFGAQISQRDVLRYHLSASCNVATRMLVRKHGIEGYQQWVDELGGQRWFVRYNVFNSQLNAYDAGLFAREIHNFIEADYTHSSDLQAGLLSNLFPFIVSDYPVASKSGWLRGYAWHDMAIVYAPSPFVLVILSRRDGNEQDYQAFADISMALQQFNNTWFVR